ncbi:MAG TPA: S8 family serine peptidase [Acidimicrobiales bacterium]|nr:S8 family serine peptidase [Acidimicrobiales bacterium]
MNRIAALAVAAALVVLTAGVALASDDPEYVLQYGPQQIYAPEAWTVSRGAGVVIAVVDSGIQLDHPDLAAKLVPGYDFLEDDDQPQDTDGHGTHVAGSAAAITDNGIGVAGVAPDAKIMPIRVLAGEASSPRSILSVQEGIRFAVDNGAQVINLSLSEIITLGPEAIRTLETSCLDAYQNGSLCIVAAGNDGNGKPSGYNNDFQAILVAANDRDKEMATFSQRADTKWGVTAPGVGIHSTVPGSSYGIKQGTSMAAPHVAGVAALLFAQGLTIDQVVDKIISTATPMNDGGGTSGAGLVNAAAAVGAAYTPEAPPTTAAGGAPATTAPPRAGGGPRPTAVATTVPEGPVVLDEGTFEEGDFVEATDDGDDFETALGGVDEPEPISYSEGITLSFVLSVLLFVAILGVVGVVARRIVLRRGIGEIKA